MTGASDEINPELLNDQLAEAAQLEEPVDPPSPLGDLSQLLEEGGSSVFDDEPSAGSSTGSSIFGDPAPLEIPSSQVDSEQNLTAADEGTAIISKGRAELEEYAEHFIDDVETTGAIDPSTMDTWVEEEEFPRVTTEAANPAEDSDAPALTTTHDPSVGGLLLNQLEDAPLDTNVAIWYGDRSRSTEETTHSTGNDSTTQPTPTITRMTSLLNTSPAEADSPPTGESGILDLGSLPIDGSGSGDLSAAVTSDDDIESSETGLSLELMTGAIAAGAISASATGSFRADHVGPKSATALPQAPNRTLLLALGGYALVVTLICVLLLSLLAAARSGSQLESLPDVAPEPVGKMSLIPANAVLPAGHLLALGERQTFGLLQVEPLRITRGPLRFVYAGTSGEQGFQSEPVLKLWVKLTNVSAEQSFAPLDGKLLFRRSKDHLRANNFVVRKSDQEHGLPLVMIHHDPLLSEADWSLEQQQLGHVLKPGESLETYLPTTEEGLDQLSGELIWRMHVRKGHSQSGHGVTTLVEVSFHEDQIEPEGA